MRGDEFGQQVKSTAFCVVVKAIVKEDKRYRFR